MEKETLLDKLISSKWGLMISWIPTIILLFLPFTKKIGGGQSLIEMMSQGVKNNGDWGLGQYYTYLHIIFFLVVVTLSFGKKETDVDKIEKMYKGNKWLINILLFFMLFITYKVFIILTWYTQVFFVVYFILMYRMVNYHFEKYYNYTPSNDSTNEDKQNDE